MDRVPASIAVPVNAVPVSIIIPAYNEALRLPAGLPALVTVARRIPGAEIIVVDDGSTDGTGALAEGLLAELPGGRVLRLPWNSGKGAAVRAGVSVARGDSIVFVDADGASDPNDLPLLLAALEHAEVALGSRRIGAGAVRTNGRRVGSWAFNQITRSLASLDVADTQCGFKAFRGPEAKLLFSLARSTGFGFDVEVLSIARSIGYRIAEVPVRWAETPGGTFRVTRHTPAMLVDVVRARRYLNRAAPSLVTGRADAEPEPVSAEPGPAVAPAAPAAPTKPGVPTTPRVPTKPRGPVPPAPAPSRSPAPVSRPGSVRSPRVPLAPPRRPEAGTTDAAARPAGAVAGPGGVAGTPVPADAGLRAGAGPRPTASPVPASVPAPAPSAVPVGAGVPVGAAPRADHARSAADRGGVTPFPRKVV